MCVCLCRASLHRTADLNRSVAVIEEAAAGKNADLQALVSKGQTWEVEKEPRKA